MTSATVANTPAAEAPPVVPRKRAFNWGMWGGYLSILIIVVWCLAPFYWMVVMSFRNKDYPFDTTLYPNHLTLENYRFAFNTKNNHFGRSLINGLIIGTSVTVLGMLIGVFAAY